MPRGCHLTLHHLHRRQYSRQVAEQLVPFQGEQAISAQDLALQELDAFRNPGQVTIEFTGEVPGVVVRE